MGKTNAIIVLLIIANTNIIKAKTNEAIEVIENAIESNDGNSTEVRNPADVFDGVYRECVIFFSYSCIQNKTLKYLNEMNDLDEVPVIGNYVKFVKIDPTSDHINSSIISEPKDLSSMIDDAVDQFFDQHRLRLHTLGRDMDVARTVDDFVGRKRRKGGGGGGGGDKGDGGKKKMMMMAMMCMKMKMMVMLPAMMGMMGMMSFKGMMFSMMSFMIAKMMLLMKLLEKKGGGGGGGGGDGSWASGGGGGGGAWMPAGGGGGGGSSDGYGGSGGGYNAAGEWQSRSIPELLTQEMTPPEQLKYQPQPLISYITPLVRYSNGNPHKKNGLGNLNDGRVEVAQMKKLNDEIIIAVEEGNKVKSRKRRENNDETIQKNMEKKENKLYNNLGSEKKIREYEKVKEKLKPYRYFKNYEWMEALSDDKRSRHINDMNKRNFESSIFIDDEQIRKDDEMELQDRKYKDLNYYKFNAVKGITPKININDNEVIITSQPEKVKSRKRRGIVDLINYISSILKKNIFLENYKHLNTYPKYRYVNGVKYVYYPQRVLNRFKHPKMVPVDSVKYNLEEEKPMVVEDYNKGEIVDEAPEGRMNRKKFQKVKETVKDVVEDNPWE